MIVLRVAPSVDGGPSLPALKALAARFPGRHDLQVHVGASRLTLGPAWRYEASEGLLAALSEFGDVQVTG